VRMALGATRGNILGLIYKRWTALVADWRGARGRVGLLAVSKMFEGAAL